MAQRGRPATAGNRLAALREQDTAPIAKVVAAATGATNGHAADADDFDIHAGIVRHLGLDFTLGSALELIGEARRLTGDARRVKLERAIRYLQDEARHC